MKYLKSTILVLALAHLALSVGNCTHKACAICEKNSEGTLYCSECVGKAITGEAFKTTCSGGPLIEGCRVSKLDGNGKPYCSTCYEDKGYFKKDGVCIKCEISENYWDNGDKQCKARTQIADCDQYYSKSDTCLVCKKGFGRYDISKKCGKLPDNCTSLQGSESSIVCYECEEGYSYYSNKCNKNTIANCSRQESSSVCDTCNEFYYKDGEECKKSTAKGCSSWKSASLCQNCAPGYYKSDSGECISIGIENCYDAETNDRTLCDDCMWSEEHDFQLSNDQKHCVDVKECRTDEGMKAHFVSETGPEFYCIECNTEGNYGGTKYWATDVIGESRVQKKNSSSTFWPQKCTKSGFIPVLIVSQVLVGYLMM